MASHPLHSTPYSLDDIYRYADGRMTSEEADRLTTAMREDPFLRDAVDGVIGHSPIHINDHVSQLHQRFNKPATRRRILPAWTMAAAAGLALFAIAFVVYQQIDFSSFGPLAKADETRNDKSDMKAEQAISSQQTLTFDEAQADVSNSIALIDSIEDESIIESAPKARRKRRPRRKTIRPGIVAGSVTDTEGNPLTGANIYFPNNQANITSDFNGKFAVELRSIDSLAIVNYDGYDSGSFSINGDGPQRFVLNRSLVALNDMAETDDEPASPAVSFSGNEVAESLTLAKEAAPAMVSAQPEKGFKKYGRYIKRNRTIPTAAKRAKVNGAVVVKFKVLPNGELFDFRIVRSLGYGCDEEAIRLIKEGPKWELENNNGIGEVTYEVIFD